jgi:hypothetical protein
VVVADDVLELGTVLVDLPLPVCETDTVLVLELVALSDSTGVSDERGVDEMDMLGDSDSDSAAV